MTIYRLISENRCRGPMLVVGLTTALYVDGNLDWTNFLVWHTVAVAIIFIGEMS